jgi:hypothetical protein
MATNLCATPTTNGGAEADDAVTPAGPAKEKLRARVEDPSEQEAEVTPGVEGVAQSV